MFGRIRLMLDKIEQYNKVSDYLKKANVPLKQDGRVLDLVDGIKQYSNSDALSKEYVKDIASGVKSSVENWTFNKDSIVKAMNAILKVL